MKTRTIRIRIVDGQKVRDTKDPDFHQGGNGRAYSYVPRGEIWIERGLPDQDAIAVHEFVELLLMSKGWNYDEAHDRANKLERGYRKPR
jgi:hypothetical protein